MTEIIQAQSVTEIGAVRDLFVEYAQSLGFSLCFQGFDHELAYLPGDYSPPGGRLLLARVDSAPAGCVGVHALSQDICEIKRLYVRPEFRRHRLGRTLAEKAIEEAREIGYSTMRLDTIEDKMKAAVQLYRELGFVEIAPYRANPIPSALYMELQLRPSAEAQRHRA
jgi:ribosomal protein S18 acetylase RimI-like enzyme